MAVPMFGAEMSGAQAGAEGCGRRDDVREVADRLSPVNSPSEPRDAMRGYAIELIDNLGGKDKVASNQEAILNKILGP